VRTLVLNQQVQITDNGTGMSPAVQGKGSTFSVALPLNHAAHPPASYSLLSLIGPFSSHTGQPSLNLVVFFTLVLGDRLENLVSERRLVDHCALRLLSQRPELYPMPGSKPSRYRPRSPVFGQYKADLPGFDYNPRSDAYTR
jgi:hypothetical protein